MSFKQVTQSASKRREKGGRLREMLRGRSGAGATRGGSGEGLKWEGKKSKEENVSRWGAEGANQGAETWQSGGSRSCSSCNQQLWPRGLIKGTNEVLKSTFTAWCRVQFWPVWTVSELAACIPAGVCLTSFLTPSHWAGRLQCVFSGTFWLDY